MLEGKPQDSTKLPIGIDSSALIEVSHSIAHVVLELDNLFKRRPAFRNLAMVMAKLRVVDVGVNATLEY